MPVCSRSYIGAHTVTVNSPYWSDLQRFNNDTHERRGHKLIPVPGDGRNRNLLVMETVWSLGGPRVGFREWAKRILTIPYLDLHWTVLLEQTCAVLCLNVVNLDTVITGSEKRQCLRPHIILYLCSHLHGGLIKVKNAVAREPSRRTGQNIRFGRVFNRVKRGRVSSHGHFLMLNLNLHLAHAREVTQTSAESGCLLCHSPL